MNKLKSYFTLGPIAIPQPIASSIRRLYALGTISAVLFSVMFIAMGFYTGLVASLAMGLCLCAMGYAMQLSFSKKGYDIFEGVCTGIEYGIGGYRPRSFFAAGEDNRTFIFQYQKGYAPISEGDTIIAYMKKGTKSYEDPFRKCYRFASYVCIDVLPALVDDISEKNNQ